jgi:hypothetical protein
MTTLNDLIARAVTDEAERRDRIACERFDASRDTLIAMLDKWLSVELRGALGDTFEADGFASAYLSVAVGDQTYVLRYARIPADTPGSFVVCRADGEQCVTIPLPNATRDLPLYLAVVTDRAGSLADDLRAEFFD